MRALTSFEQIFLHKTPVDGRKQINGLALLVQSAMGEDPFGPGLFVFVSKGRDNVRLLYWDNTGFAMWTKRLEKEKFRWPVKLEGEILKLTSEHLTWLLNGLDLSALVAHKHLKFSSMM